MRVLLTNLIDLHVLPVEDVLQIVVMDEVLNPIGGDVPGPGHFNVVQKWARLGCLVDDLFGQEQSRALSSQFPVAAGREDHFA